MSKHVRIFLTGLMAMIPLAITVWLVVFVATWLGAIGEQMVKLSPRLQAALGDAHLLVQIVGATIFLAAIYLFGLLMNLVLFRKMFGLIEKLFANMPGVKIIYNSVRDIVKLFGGSGHGDDKGMGKVVIYRPPGSPMEMLGIMTNDNPAEVNGPGRKRKVTIYVPLGYQIGGLNYYVNPEDLEEIDMSVEAALKLAATASVGCRQDEKKDKKES